MSVTSELYKVLDDMPERTLSGWELFEIMHDITGIKTYPSTLIKRCREYADMTGATFECIDAQNSKYHYVPGFGMGNAIRDNKI